MPTKRVQVFLIFHILMNIYLLLFLIIAIFTGVRWCFIRVVICISLIINDTEYFFLNILAIFMYSLEKYMFKAFVYLKNQVVNILPLTCGSTNTFWKLTDFLICYWCCSATRSCLTLCNPMECSMPGLPCPSLSPKVCSSSHPLNLWCHQTISSSVICSPFALNLSQHQSFPMSWLLASGGQNIEASALAMSIYSTHTSNDYLGLISLRIDWFDLLALQGTLKSLLQHHSSKASILSHSAFFMIQLSHLYMTTERTIALTMWTFVSKVISLLFNTLSRFVIAFLPRSNHLLISWLQSPSAVIFEPKKRKSVTTSNFSPPICHEVMELDAMIFIIF